MQLPKMIFSQVFALMTIICIAKCLPFPLQKEFCQSKRILPPGNEPSAGCTQCKASLTFSTKESAEYLVGSNIPKLPFKTKPSWAGNIAFPDTATTKNASLFFWLWGKDTIDPGKDLIIWMNGGPGCSSLLALSSENGPFTFFGSEPKPNPYSWTNAANILFISQPVGVSFTTGTANNSNEEQISEQLTLWLVEFFKIFPELQHFNIFITGESYMGQFLPYQIQALRKNPITKNLSIKGGMLIAPAFSDSTAQVLVPTYQFVKEHQKALKFSDADVSTIKAESEKCKYNDFLQQYLIYPAKGRLPYISPNCNPFDKYMELAKKYNPHYDYYNVNTPKETSNDDQPTSIEKFFSDVSVQNYIHAPHQTFKMCKNVFTQDNTDQSESGDSTPSYSNSLFAQMIEFCGKFIIMAGTLDGLVFSEGVKLALQNLTFGGVQGFNQAPHVPLYDLDGKQKAIGTNAERGLRLAIVSDSGHMIPKDQPSFSLNAIFTLLGQSDWTSRT